MVKTALQSVKSLSLRLILSKAVDDTPTRTLTRTKRLQRRHMPLAVRTPGLVASFLPIADGLHGAAECNGELGLGVAQLLAHGLELNREGHSFSPSNGTYLTSVRYAASRAVHSAAAPIVVVTNESVSLPTCFML